MKKWKILFLIPILYLISTLVVNIIGENRELKNPVKDASSKSWDKQSYWYYPWGNSGVHKGIDIFAPHKAIVLSPVDGLVIDAGYGKNGGNYLYMVSKEMRVYYFAHLNITKVKTLDYVKKGSQLGEVGNTGNALSKPYHLHFSVFSLVPIIKNYDGSSYEGWKKMFYLNPEKLIVEK